jgi:hypothetical protein
MRYVAVVLSTVMLVACGGGGGGGTNSSPPTATVAPSNFAGTWVGSVSGSSISITMSQSGNQLTSTAVTGLSGAKFDGTVSGNTAVVTQYVNNVKFAVFNFTLVDATHVQATETECTPPAGAVCSPPVGTTIAFSIPAPVAAAGQNTSTFVGNSVTLNGTGSKVYQGNGVQYAWTILEKPASSTASLTGPSTSNPSFVPDTAGDYVAQLTVSDGNRSSTPAKVVVSVKSPSASAGANASIVMGSSVTLSGTTDPSPMPPSTQYAWSVALKPDGSAPTVSGSATLTPTFTPDMAGAYQLKLNATTLNSTSTSTVSVFVKPQSASAGANASIVMGSSVTLSGTTDPSPMPPSTQYVWSVVLKPEGSAPTMSGSATLTPTFTPDMAGAYQLSLNSKILNSTSTSTNTIYVTPVGTYTIGSTKADVSKIQGAPMTLLSYPSLGYERWQFDIYGTSVTISIPNGLVTEWNNYSGVLKVVSVAGFNSTGGAKIAVGSTFDDVIRIQGTPVQILAYPSLGYEQWGYDKNGITHIVISTRTGMVTGWNNYNGSLKI